MVPVLTRPTEGEAEMTETPTGRALKNRQEADVTEPAPQMPDPREAPIKELTAYCKEVGKTPENWTKIKAPEKRTAFMRLFCPEVTEGFDSSDKLHLIAERVENLREGELSPTVQRLTEMVGDSYFELGGVFSRVISDGWYVEAGHENFKKWVAASTDMKHAKAHYLVQIYEKLNRLDVSWSKFAGIGWTKVRILLPVLTAENAGEWIAKAKESTRVELEEAVKKAKGENVEDESTTVNKAFKLHPEQLETVQAAINDMKENLPTEHENVALEYICAGHLEGRVEISRVQQLGKPASAEEAGAALKVVYEWLKENSETPFDACAPVVDAFEAVFTREEASMLVKAN